MNVIKHKNSLSQHKEREKEQNITEMIAGILHVQLDIMALCRNNTPVLSIFCGSCLVILDS